MRLATALLALIITVSAAAATIATGDVAAEQNSGCCCILCPPPPPDLLLANDGTLKQSFPGFALAFGPNGHLFVDTFSGLVEYDTSMNVVHTTTPFSYSFFTVAQNGDLYALTLSTTLTILSPAGVVKQTFSLPNGDPTGSLGQVIDVAPDQCTVFYTDSALHGHRFNACTGQPLADLAPGTWNAVRAMSDGGYLAAHGGTLNIFDANNQLLRTYPEQSWTISSAAFDADPRFVWLALQTPVKLRLADGAIVGNAKSPFFFGVSAAAVNGEQRPASADFALTIPALSPGLLFAVALGLIALAWQRLRA